MRLPVVEGPRTRTLGDRFQWDASPSYYRITSGIHHLEGECAFPPSTGWGRRHGLPSNDLRGGARSRAHALVAASGDGRCSSCDGTGSYRAAAFRSRHDGSLRGGSIASTRVSPRRRTLARPGQGQRTRGPPPHESLRTTPAMALGVTSTSGASRSWQKPVTLAAPTSPEDPPAPC